MLLILATSRTRTLALSTALGLWLGAIVVAAEPALDVTHFWTNGGEPEARASAIMDPDERIAFNIAKGAFLGRFGPDLSLGIFGSTQ
jgi:hypothetical protein